MRVPRKTPDSNTLASARDPRRSLRLLVLLATTLGGCAAPRGGDDVRHDAAVLLATPAATAASPAASAPDAIAARVAELLSTPLSREDAVTLALLNNPLLARRLAQLDLDAAERVRASRPPNPSLTLARLERAGERETDRGVSIDLIGLLAWPLQRRIANAQYEAARHDALRDALALAGDTRAAWVDAVAANAARDYAQKVVDAAETGRLYAERLAAAGNASQLEARRARAFAAEAQADLARADSDARLARERLVRLLGLEDDTRLALPAALPALPDAPLARRDSEQRAIDQRLDVQAAKRRAEATASALHLSRATGVVNVLDVGYQSNTATDAPRQTGAEVTLELPLFDFGSARATEARARYDAALADVAATAVQARSEVRAAWSRYEASHAAAKRYRDEVVPEQSAITHDLLLRWNGMLVGPFELLDQAREQAGAVARADAALADFWRADAALAGALLGAAPAPDATGGSP